MHILSTEQVFHVAGSKVAQSNTVLINIDEKQITPDRGDVVSSVGRYHSVCKPRPDHVVQYGQESVEAP